MGAGPSSEILGSVRSDFGRQNAVVCYDSLTTSVSQADHRGELQVHPGVWRGVRPGQVKSRCGGAYQDNVGKSHNNRTVQGGQWFDGERIGLSTAAEEKRWLAKQASALINTISQSAPCALSWSFQMALHTTPTPPSLPLQLKPTFTLIFPDTSILGSARSWRPC